MNTKATDRRKEAEERRKGKTTEMINIQKQHRRGDTGEQEEKKEQHTEDGAGKRRNVEDRPFRIIITSPGEQEPKTTIYKRKTPTSADYRYRS